MAREIMASAKRDVYYILSDRRKPLNEIELRELAREVT